MQSRIRRPSLGHALLGLGAALALLGGGCRPTPPQADAAPSTLVILVPSLPDALDPYQASAASDDVIAFNSFEPLVAFNPVGTLDPVLAQSWDASRAGELTVRLKPNLRFHDGSPLDAAAVVACLEAARKPGSPFAARLLDRAELRAGDKDTLTLRASPGGFVSPYALADIPIVKQASGGIPGGTGPYRVTTFTADSTATLRAAEGSAAQPTLTTVTVRRYRGPEDAEEQLLGADPPVLLAPPREVVPMARSHANYRLVTQQANAVIALALDEARDPTPGVGLAQNPFRKPEVRRALRLALDLEALRNGFEGGAVTATQMVPPLCFGFDATLQAPAPALEEARGLLRKAGLPKGFEVRLDLAQEHEALGRALASQLEGVGIRLKLNPLKSERLEGVMENESSLALFAWRPGADPSWALAAALHGRTADGRLGAGNWTGYSDAEVDQKLEAALAGTDPGARREALQGALRRLAGDSAWIPLLVPMRTIVLPKGLTFPARADGRIGLSEARLQREPTPTPPPGRRRQGSDKQASLETR
jgi:ABC-type transport system substrate-binding protein